jgi:ribosomal protein L37AE/L43A
MRIATMTETAPAKAAPMREDVTPADALVTRLYRRGMSEDDSCNVDSGDLMREAAAMIERLAHTACPDAGDEDVERVARAMWEVSHLGGWNDAKPGTMTTTEYDRDVYRDHARAALAALREGVERGMVERLQVALQDVSVCLSDDDDMFPDRATRDDAMRSIVAAALSPEQPR